MENFDKTIKEMEPMHTTRLSLGALYSLYKSLCFRNCIYCAGSVRGAIYFMLVLFLYLHCRCKAFILLNQSFLGGKMQEKVDIYGYDRKLGNTIKAFEVLSKTNKELLLKF